MMSEFYLKGLLISQYIQREQLEDNIAFFQKLYDECVEADAPMATVLNAQRMLANSKYILRRCDTIRNDNSNKPL